MAMVFELFFARVENNNNKIFSTQKFTTLGEVWKTLHSVQLEKDWTIVVLKQDSEKVYVLEELSAKEFN